MRNLSGFWSWLMRMGSPAAFVAAGFLLILPVCIEADAHVAITAAGSAEPCCSIADGTPNKVPSLVSSTPGGQIGIESRGAEESGVRRPLGPREIKAGFEPRAVSFYVRSARILR